LQIGHRVAGRFEVLLEPLAGVVGEFVNCVAVASQAAADFCQRHAFEFREQCRPLFFR
jgi:hypothetical protein